MRDHFFTPPRKIEENISLKKTCEKSPLASKLYGLYGLSVCLKIFILLYLDPISRVEKYTPSCQEPRVFYLIDYDIFLYTNLTILTDYYSVKN